MSQEDDATRKRNDAEKSVLIFAFGPYPFLSVVICVQ
jgi:hypothetical protein